MEMYPSDLEEAEWSLIKPLIIFKRKGIKCEENVVRLKLNGILYVLKTGCQWRMLPKEYGHWNKVYSQFKRWRKSSIFDKILNVLNRKVRIKAGKEESPSLMIIDAQSVKTVQKGGLKDTMLVRK
jgi:transposase